jgi:hypothetical protein
MRGILSVISLLLLVSCATNEHQGNTKRSGTPKNIWIKNLSQTLPLHLCKPESPFLPTYKGSNCLADMNRMYELCTNEDSNVKIPNTLTSVHEANKLGSIVAECMSANYHGGQLLEIFNMFQTQVNKN